MKIKHFKSRKWPHTIYRKGEKCALLSTTLPETWNGEMSQTQMSPSPSKEWSNHFKFSATTWYYFVEIPSETLRAWFLSWKWEFCLQGFLVFLGSISNSFDGVMIKIVWCMSLHAKLNNLMTMTSRNFREYNFNKIFLLYEKSLKF